MANFSILGKQRLSTHNTATSGNSGQHWQDIPHQPTQHRRGDKMDKEEQDAL